MFISDEAWLNAVNALLGIVTAVATLAIGTAVSHDVLVKYRLRREAAEGRIMHIPELGFVMTDGGEPVKKDKN